MKLRTIFTSSFFLKSIFIVSLFILIFISAISYKHTLVLSYSSKLMEHSYKVRVEMEQLISYMKDAETGQRGFIISRDSVFLAPYISAQGKVKESFLRLKELTRENPLQASNLTALEHLFNLRFSYLAISLKQSADSLADKGQFVNSMMLGKNIMDDLRVKANRMMDLETVYLEKQQVKYKEEISFTPLIALLLTFFSLLIFIISYYKINRDIETQKKINEALRITTESFKQAEEIGSFSSWHWDLESDKVIYSDNQYHLLGVAPRSFDPNSRKIMEFIHPDDRSVIVKGREQVMKGHHPLSVFYRVIRSDGELRYFKTIGKILTDHEGRQKTVIGINRDVTSQYLKGIALEERNRDLEQSNKDLAFFNHVASHDLQEPLRKIQTYISRISEKEISALSETGREYLARIQAGAGRMRILIDDLLLFSRTNKNEKIFENSDLNLLLENAKQELAQAIEEKKAFIQSAALPALFVIPFQIQQLFINLISNSLKYSRPGIATVIKIECETIVARELHILKTESYKKYSKISFMDNGIGFDQQYAENIFTLFYRLHRASEYSGTGIGLAICKKIVENHNGFITAEGRPGMGSTFNIFFPM